MYIESVNNDKIRLWSKLKTKKGRLEQEKFLVEGFRLVEELLASTIGVDGILWDSGTPDLPRQMLDEIERRGIRRYDLSGAAFAAVADTVTPQGVIAIAHLPQKPAVFPAQVLVLDGLRDAGNVGTLLRSADGFRVTEVICHQGTVDVFAPKVVRASMGGLFRIAAHNTDAIQYLSKWLERYPEGKVLYASAAHGTPCDKLDLCQPTAIVVGSEATGVSPELAVHCTDAVRIPMSGHTESLNAAMAGSILMYEMFRQRPDRY